MGSTLLPPGERRPITTKGHGTEALGPSDTSDSGSDIVGGPGIGQADEIIPLDRGSNSDLAAGSGRRGNAGDDIGDGNIDSDSDSTGTGEHAAAGKDDIATNRDRMPDKIEQLPSSR